MSQETDYGSDLESFDVEVQEDGVLRVIPRIDGSQSPVSPYEDHLASGICQDRSAEQAAKRRKVA